MTQSAEARESLGGADGEASARASKPSERGMTGRAVCARVLLGCGVLLVAVLLVGGLFGARAHDRPAAAMSDDVVLERVKLADASAAPGTGVDSAALLARALRDLPSAISAARALVDAGRRTGEPRLFGHAEAALSPWLRAGAPSAAYVLRAAARGGRHDFEGARADLERAVTLDPRDAQAWLSRAVLASVRGDAVEAMESCGGLSRAGARFAAALCDGHALGMVGRLEEAIARVMEALVRHGARASSGERAWASGLLGELWARDGDALQAEQHLRAAMAEDSADPSTRIALVDLLLDLGRDGEAQALARPGSAAHEGLALRRAVAEARLGMQLSTVARALAARFEEARAREDDMHLREAAWYELEVLRQPRRALKSALGNFRVQREPVDVRLLLAAAHAAGAPSAAAPALEWMDMVGYLDGRLARLREVLRARSAPRAVPARATAHAPASPRSLARDEKRGGR